jgi:hypothetical protein
MKRNTMLRRCCRACAQALSGNQTSLLAGPTAGAVAVLGSVLAGRLILPANGSTAAHGYPLLSLSHGPTYAPQLARRSTSP